VIANDLRTGTTIVHSDGLLYQILEFHHTKPGKGGAFVRVKMRRLKDGRIIEHTFRAEEKVERAFIERKKMEWALPFLVENIECDVLMHKEEIVAIELPETVVLEVVETDPGEKGDTASGGSKPAKLQTGYVVRVPLFIKEGDKVRIDTRTGAYVERVQD